MAAWFVSLISIIAFKLVHNQELTKFCKPKPAVFGGNELHCTTLANFTNLDQLLNRTTHGFTCTNCTLKALNETTFRSLPVKNSINFLNLINSEIQTIKPNSFSRFISLKVISLKNNSISELSIKAFTNLKRLHQIDLSYNLLTILSNHLFEPVPNCDLLSFTHNKLFYIQPEAFFGLKYLKFLYLNHNLLTKLEGKTFRHLESLLVLNLENNKIVEIDSFAFSNLNQLHSLYLSHNQIAFLVSYNFKPLNNLFDLQLRNNSLIDVQTSAFNGLTNLKVLSLGENNLETVQKYGFIGLDQLQSLELINNNFKQFNFDFIENLEKLHILWLDGNQIRNFTISYKCPSLKQLAVIGLSDNNLTTLNYKLLHNKVPSLGELYIGGNSWKCEALVNMFNYFNSSKIATCFSNSCSLNQTEQFMQKICLEQQPEEEFDWDYVAENGVCWKISHYLFTIGIITSYLV